MNYTCDIEIELPREKVVELFDSPEQQPKWQRGLQSVELKSGERGKPGAISELVFLHKGRQMGMRETVLRNELPDSFAVLYEAKNVRNENEFRFVELGPDRTKLIAHQDFQFSGFMKLVGLLFKSAFPKQTRLILEDFKNFAEKGTDVRELASK